MADAPPATRTASAGRSARAPVRVMVVDDSAVIRGLVSRWVDDEPDLEIVAKCANGQIAVDAVADARPDVIILDIEMPAMDGLTALPQLLAARPQPRIIVASTVTRRNAQITLKALWAGASECLPKPEANRSVAGAPDFRRDLIAKVRALGGLEAAERRSRAAAGAAPQAYTLVPFNRGRPRILGIGSSTGGPKALAAVLADARPGLAELPVLVTQHMPPTFTALLADNLQRLSGLPVREAEHGERPRPGTVYIAPGGSHLVVRRERAGPVLALDNRPPVNFAKPSVDVMFESIAAAFGGEALGLVLTGMGHDGAAGTRALRAAGGSVIAQDEATSVVWGMPGAAAQSGMCSAVLPVEAIGPRIATIAMGRGR